MLWRMGVAKASTWRGPLDDLEQVPFSVLEIGPMLGGAALNLADRLDAALNQRSSRRADVVDYEA